VAERAGLTPERLDQVVAAIGEALDGRRLARQELGEELANRLGRWVLERRSPPSTALAQVVAGDRARGRARRAVLRPQTRATA
jgi:hypothetical protein